MDTAEHLQTHCGRLSAVCTHSENDKNAAAPNPLLALLAAELSNARNAQQSEDASEEHFVHIDVGRLTNANAGIAIMQALRMVEADVSSAEQLLDDVRTLRDAVAFPGLKLHMWQEQYLRIAIVTTILKMAPIQFHLLMCATGAGKTLVLKSFMFLPIICFPSLLR
jgi:hypothetical protein